MPILQGKAKWAKVVGKPQKGYETGEVNKEWSIDVYIDAAAAKSLRAQKAGKAIKQNDDGESYVSFKRRAYNSVDKVRSLDAPAKPIKIVDRAGKDWDGKTLIGNGSTVNVMYALNDTQDENKKRPSIIKLQVWDLVKYEGKGSAEQEDFPVDEAGAETWGDDAIPFGEE